MISPCDNGKCEKWYWNFAEISHLSPGHLISNGKKTHRQKKKKTACNFYLHGQTWGVKVLLQHLCDHWSVQPLNDLYGRGNGVNVSLWRLAYGIIIQVTEWLCYLRVMSFPAKQLFLQLNWFDLRRSCIPVHAATKCKWKFFIKHLHKRFWHDKCQKGPKTERPCGGLVSQ